MKIVHTSDLHLGSALTSRLSPEKTKERKAELISSFERSVEEAALRGATVYIIAGDLFDTEKITQGVRQSVISIISRAPAIDFLYLPGNHERLALLDGAEMLPQNLKIFGDDWTYFDYGFVTIAGRSRTDSTVFDNLTLDREKKNIVVLHGALSERSSDGIIGLRDAAERGIDYMALGHYHTYSNCEIDDRGIAVYCGTPEGRGFDETGECGFCLIDTDGQHMTYSFIPHAKRKIVIKNVDISMLGGRVEIDEAIAIALADVSFGDIVRVVLTGRHLPEISPDTDTVLGRYRDKYYHFEIKDETRILINPEDYRYDKSLKGEFIRLVLEKEGLSDKMRERIIRTGIGALIGDLTDI